MKISIIDTGSANLNSVVQAFKRIGYEAVVSSEIADFEKADRLVLPGVGTASAVMDGINKFKLRDFILETKKPLLGICHRQRCFVFPVFRALYYALAKS